MNLATHGLIETRSSPMAPPAWRHQPLAAIRIGVEEIALKIVRPIVTGRTEVLHAERISIGGVEDGAPGALEPAAADRMLAVLRRWGRTCRNHAALPRVVAGSAFCGLPGAADLVSRASRDAELDIAMLSSRQEAQILGWGALMGNPASERALLVTTDGPTMSLVFAAGDEPVALWTLGLDPARFREIARATARATDAADVAELRREARRMVSEARLGAIPGTVGQVILVSAAARIAWTDGRSARTPELDGMLFRGLILQALIDHLGLAGVKLSRADLLDGVLADLAWAQSREARAPS